MLKNQLVCALLLLPLLTACNGTTSSGNSEVNRQRNSPPTNTTNVPSVEAKNPPPTTGNAVRVARWSRNPKGGSLLALQKGRLVIANNCLVIQDHEGAPPTLLIFPYDSGLWDDAKRTFTYRGKVIGIGEFIEVGGGSIQTPNALKAHGKYDLPDCGINTFFQVF